MAVTLPRETWPDKRLDDLNQKVDDGFASADKKMDEGFARLDKKIDDGMARVDADIRELRGDIKGLRNDMSARFGAIDGRFESLNKTLIGAAVAIVVALIGSNATLVGLALL